MIEPSAILLILFPTYLSREYHQKELVILLGVRTNYKNVINNQKKEEMKYLTWSEYFRSKEFIKKLKKYNENITPKIKIIWTEN